MEILVPILVALLIAAVAIWAIQALKLPDPIRMVAIVVVAVVLIAFLLRFL